MHNLDANYVGKLERGDHRWPSALYRQAFRAVLKAATDADLGFYTPGRSEGMGGHQSETGAPPAAEGFPHDRPELHAEIVTSYPRRAMAPDRLWLDLLKSAHSEIALFANASLFLPEDNPESISLLRTKAQSGDAGYDSAVTRATLAERGLLGEIAHKGDKAPIQAGRRWHVERTNAWHNAFNRLQRCYERVEHVIDAFFDLADTIITLRSLIRQAWTRYRWDTRPTRRP